MKIYLFLLSICRNELISAPNIITFSSNQRPLDNEKFPHASNPVPYPEYLYLFKNVITYIHFNNKQNNQKLKVKQNLNPKA